MSKKRSFISFDYDHDADLKNLLVGQARNSDSPFEITDLSIKEAIAKDWKANARRRIKGCDIVIVICGKYTNTATGVSAELKIAQEENVPYFLLWGRSDDKCVKPVAAKDSDKIYKWTWDNLKLFDWRGAMIKIFISHKQEDSYTANKIANELKAMNIPYYLDVLDFSTTGSGKELTDHIKQNLNDCTDIIVVMSEHTRYSQWVPFEVGMSAQNDMPTATFLQENVSLPDFLVYWPRLKQPSDIRKYIAARKTVQHEYALKYQFETAETRRSQTARFYDVLKRTL